MLCVAGIIENSTLWKRLSDESTGILDFGWNRDCGVGVSWGEPVVGGIGVAHIRNCDARRLEISRWMIPW